VKGDARIAWIGKTQWGLNLARNVIGLYMQKPDPSYWSMIESLTPVLPSR
jgi:hypothetical protein